MAATTPATIGIDLGTTYSCVSIFENGKPRVIANDKGLLTTPSYVAFTKKERLIGDDAKKQIGMNPKNTVFGIKRIIGRKFDDPVIQQDITDWSFVVKNIDQKMKVEVEYQGEVMQLFPEQISAMVLKKLKDAADANMRMKHTDAVITVPAYFTDSQRQATLNAGRIAGLNVKRLLNEPTAAALAYGIGKIEQDTPQKILIFDLGGGTFDVSILTVYEGNFEVEAVDGDSHLGGEDFDNLLVNEFVEEFQKQLNENLRSDEKAMNRLRKECEEAKKTLSTAFNAQPLHHTNKTK
ncbi:heat shock 70 kDa protein 1-like [Sitodiplosis mosellana]|uniref:heat shock 70 kDa protein 1-like n=1 Tax=Sitodiplosis mosellana TaxID=263140 RepID=UPI002443DC52|nr:heat shock 70 kDa protein 1-like [Sitodiplosis mosellana]XP_055296741.1 heat shock 70 kDa protein 1-like [Sitodiplosis mosellana]XP_055296742.1 heat shock 70 kDa protein 1-like [Sitodiplosis mosellana]